MAKPRRTQQAAQRERMFDHWLNSPSLSYAGVSFTEFRKDCEAGKVPGFEPEGFVGPASDTVHGNERDAS